MAHMLQGNSREIISQNVRSLCREGKSEAQATCLAMKYAKKSTKSLNKAAKKIVKRFNKDRG